MVAPDCDAPKASSSSRNTATMSFRLPQGERVVVAGASRPRHLQLLSHFNETNLGLKLSLLLRYVPISQ